MITRSLNFTKYLDILNDLDEYVLKHINNPEFEKCNLFKSKFNYKRFIDIYAHNQKKALTLLIWDNLLSGVNAKLIKNNVALIINPSPKAYRKVHSFFNDGYYAKKLLK